jgi:hypothetical protein
MTRNGSWGRKLNVCVCVCLCVYVCVCVCVFRMVTEDRMTVSEYAFRCPSQTAGCRCLTHGCSPDSRSQYEATKRPRMQVFQSNRMHMH